MVKGAFHRAGLGARWLANSPRRNALGMRTMEIRTVIDIGANTGQFARCDRSILPAVGDRTPRGWVVPEDGLTEKIKKPLRWLLYRPYLKVINPILERQYDPARRLGVNQWYWGYRGFEYQSLRARLNRHRAIRGSSVLVVGCGTGRDIGSWMAYRPDRLVGIDLFSYTTAWELLKTKYGPALSFVQGDISNLSNVKDNMFDIIGSDHVFEHVANLPDALREFYRVLKVDGILYAAFGPLWHCFGGDHISGYDTIANGYNHLLLERQDYLRYLAKAGDFAHSEDDGRTWVENGLFSYLKIWEYLCLLRDAGFTVMHLGIVLDPRGIKCLTANAAVRGQLLTLAEELDLIATSMCVIAGKAADRGLQRLR